MVGFCHDELSSTRAGVFRAASKQLVIFINNEQVNKLSETFAISKSATEVQRVYFLRIQHAEILHPRFQTKITPNTSKSSTSTPSSTIKPSKYVNICEEHSGNTLRSLQKNTPS
jgi:hypothetical protein